MQLSNEEISKGNKLIAEFMGVKIGVDLYSWRLGCTEPLKETHLAYHKQWGWLMAVVEKIEKGNLYFVRIEETECLITIDGEVRINEYRDTKIEAVWLAVVSFIKWYNSIDKTELKQVQ